MFSKGVLHACLYGDILSDTSFDDMTRIFEQNKSHRCIKFNHKQVDWEEHLRMCRHTNGFYCRYHMREVSFDKLVDLLRDDITVDEVCSRASTQGNDLIYPELITAAGLKFLGGEYQKSIADFIGISIDSTRRVVHMFLDAVLICTELDLHLPKTQKELVQLATGFDTISNTHSVFFSVIGAIDGWLRTTNKPSDVPIPGDFYSGHYKQFGFNVQAICDANLRFIYLCVAGPGRTNDNRAFTCLIQLHQWLENLSLLYCLIGDNAYTFSKKMIIPFSYSQEHDGYKRSYNFYLSQQRIQIEMAFGRLTTKWRIFCRNLDFSTAYNSKIVKAACKLHNYVLNEDNEDFSNNTSTTNEDWGVDALERGRENNRGYLINCPHRGVVVDINDVASSRREIILQEITGLDLQRPLYNMMRNDDIDYDTDYTDSDG